MNKIVYSIRWIASWKYRFRIRVWFIPIGPICIPMLPQIVEFRLYREWPKW